MRWFFQVLVGVAVCCVGDRVARSADSKAPEGGLQVVVKEDFEKGMERWRTTDPDPKDGVWEVVELKAGEKEDSKTNHALRVKGISKYQPPHRSPHSIALLKDVKVGDFELTARVQNTNKTAGGHRDLCIFWGYQDPSHFYYVHFGAQADPHACQIFIVNDSPRNAPVPPD